MAGSRRPIFDSEQLGGDFVSIGSLYNADPNNLRFKALTIRGQPINSTARAMYPDTYKGFLPTYHLVGDLPFQKSGEWLPRLGTRACYVGYHVTNAFGLFRWVPPFLRARIYIVDVPGDDHAIEARHNHMRPSPLFPAYRVGKGSRDDYKEAHSSIRFYCELPLYVVDRGPDEASPPHIRENDIWSGGANPVQSLVRDAKLGRTSAHARVECASDYLAEYVGRYLRHIAYKDVGARKDAWKRLVDASAQVEVEIACRNNGYPLASS